MPARRRERDPYRVPAPGTKIRRAYDLLLTGETIPVCAIGGICSLEQLRDVYDCEIVSTQRVGSRLLGRWIGNDFVPVERLSENCSAEPS